MSAKPVSRQIRKNTEPSSSTPAEIDSNLDAVKSKESNNINETKNDKNGVTSDTLNLSDAERSTATNNSATVNEKGDQQAGTTKRVRDGAAGTETATVQKKQRKQSSENIPDEREKLKRSNKPEKEERNKEKGESDDNIEIIEDKEDGNDEEADNKKAEKLRWNKQLEYLLVSTAVSTFDTKIRYEKIQRKMNDQLSLDKTERSYADKLQKLIRSQKKFNELPSNERNISPPDPLDSSLNELIHLIGHQKAARQLSRSKDQKSLSNLNAEKLKHDVEDYGNMDLPSGNGDIHPRVEEEDGAVYVEEDNHAYGDSSHIVHPSMQYEQIKNPQYYEGAYHSTERIGKKKLLARLLNLTEELANRSLERQEASVQSLQETLKHQSDNLQRLGDILEKGYSALIKEVQLSREEQKQSFNELVNSPCDISPLGFMC